MPLQTKAYLTFKREAKRLTNLVVLFSHAVPVLTRVIKLPGPSPQVLLKPADTFLTIERVAPYWLNGRQVMIETSRT